MPRRRTDPFERFMQNVNKTPTCWWWTGPTTPKGGHGVFHDYDYETKKQPVTTAHRWHWVHVNGPLDPNVVLDHKVCDNPLCVRLDHLEPTTQQGNLLRSEITQAGINSRKTHCIHNHEFSPENTYIKPNGARGCRICRNAASRRSVAKRKASE